LEWPATRARTLGPDATTRIELARYGQLWWDVDVGFHPAFAAMGSDGQLVLVVPKYVWW
jgi:hypothetical protein